MGGPSEEKEGAGIAYQTALIKNQPTKTKMKHIICSIIAIIALAVSTQAADRKLSVETLAAIRSVNITAGEQYGAGLDIGYKFNAYVTGHLRALAYESNNWRGPAIDESSLLVEAGLLKSANGSLSLSAIGGADRDWAAEDWGFSVGLRGGLALSSRISIVAESRIRAWFDQEKDLISTAGLKFSF